MRYERSKKSPESYWLKHLAPTSSQLDYGLVNCLIKSCWSLHYFKSTRSRRRKCIKLWANSKTCLTQPVYPQANYPHDDINVRSGAVIPRIMNECKPDRWNLIVHFKILTTVMFQKWKKPFQRHQEQRCNMTLLLWWSCCGGTYILALPSRISKIPNNDRANIATTKMSRIRKWLSRYLLVAPCFVNIVLSQHDWRALQY